MHILEFPAITYGLLHVFFAVFAGHMRHALSFFRVSCIRIINTSSLEKNEPEGPKYYISIVFKVDVCFRRSS